MSFIANGDEMDGNESVATVGVCAAVTDTVAGTHGGQFGTTGGTGAAGSGPTEAGVKIASTMDTAGVGDGTTLDASSIFQRLIGFVTKSNLRGVRYATIIAVLICMLFYASVVRKVISTVMTYGVALMLLVLVAICVAQIREEFASYSDEPVLLVVPTAIAKFNSSAASTSSSSATQAVLDLASTTDRSDAGNKCAAPVPVDTASVIPTTGASTGSESGGGGGGDRRTSYQTSGPGRLLHSRELKSNKLYTGAVHNTTSTSAGIFDLQYKSGPRNYNDSGGKNSTPSPPPLPLPPPGSTANNIHSDRVKQDGPICMDTTSATAPGATTAAAPAARTAAVAEGFVGTARDLIRNSSVQSSRTSSTDSFLSAHSVG